MATDPRADASAAVATEALVTTHGDIVRAARGAVGVPYKHHGRTLRGGLDCAGLILMPAALFKIVVPSPPTDYRRANRLSYVLDQMKRCFDQVGLLLAKPGMIVVMKPRRQALAHLGIIDTMSTVIEATNEPKLMQVVRRRIDWSSVRGVFAYRGVDY